MFISCLVLIVSSCSCFLWILLYYFIGVGFSNFTCCFKRFKVMSTLGDTINVVETLLSEVTFGDELDILEKELEQIASFYFIYASLSRDDDNPRRVN